MFLAAEDIMTHISDHTWWWGKLWGMDVTVLSADIVSMLIVAALMIFIIIPLANRKADVPTGGRNVLEALVIFVRDMIARPALHGKADVFLPYLLTMFCFILGMNILGIVPLRPITQLIWPHSPIGGTATSLMVVCGAMAAVTMVTLVALGLRRQAIKYHEQKGWPLVLSAILSPVLWFRSFAPAVPGVAGYILIGPLTVLEFIGVFAKCSALMIRLFANMVSGHVLIAVLVMLGMEQLASWLHHTGSAAAGIGVPVVTFLSSVVLDVMELLVVALQAYVFTFLTAIFLGLYVDPAASH